MEKTEIILPAIGEGIIEAEITRWLVREGDRVKADDPVVEVATDKVDSEVPAPADGIIQKILLGEGDVVKIGQVLAIIMTETMESEPVPEKKNIPAEKINESEEKKIVPERGDPVSRASFDTPPITIELKGTSIAFLTPVVRELIRRENITVSELSAVRGTGLGGRITKKDITEYLKHRQKTAQRIPSVSVPRTSPEKDLHLHTESMISGDALYGDGDHEVMEMDRMRRLIADHMVYSKKISPHVTSFVEVDVTNLVIWRESIKETFLKKYNQKITYTSLIIEASARALKDFPMVNISLDGYKIIRKRNINIGMATALPSGNLVVPVIRDADKKNLPGLVTSVNDLVDRARKNELKPAEIQGSTFTVTNIGQFGNITGTPIINQPEVAILAAGVIQKKPAVIETPRGDTIGIRHLMILALAYDHRVVDGALGGMFLKRIGDYLEKTDIKRSI